MVCFMRRMCFDIESDYYKPRNTGVGDPAAHRALISNSSPTFRVGVVYDEAHENCHTFLSEQIEDMVKLLASADQLISHSGRRHDVPILEAETEGLAAVLRPIPHWDLFDMGSWKSLDDLSATYIGDAEPMIKADYDTRLTEIDLIYPPEPWGAGFMLPAGNWQEGWIAKATYDVRRTYAVWKVMVARHPDLTPSKSDLG